MCPGASTRHDRDMSEKTNLWEPPLTRPLFFD